MPRRGRIRRATDRVTKFAARPILWIARRFFGMLVTIYHVPIVYRLLHTRIALLVGRSAILCHAFTVCRAMPAVRRAKRRVRRFAADRELLGWVLSLGLAIALAETLTHYFYLLRIVIGLIGGAAYIVATLYSPVFGLLFWIVSSPLMGVFAEVKFGPSIPAINGDRLCLLILLIALILWARRQSKVKSTPAIGWCILVFVLVMFANTIRAEKIRSGAQTVFDSFLAPMTLFFFARRWIQSEGVLRKALIAIVIVATFLTIFGIPEYVTRENVFRHGTWAEPELGLVRVQGPLKSPMEFGLVVALGSYVLMTILAGERRISRRILYVLMLLSYVLIIYMTLRRSVYASWILGLLVLALFSPRCRKMVLAGLVTGVMLIGAFSQKIESLPVYTERLGSKSPIQSRIVANATSIAIIKDNLVFGVGAGRYSDVVKKYLTGYMGISAMIVPTRSPHNAYFRVLIEGGLAAFVPLAFLFLSAAWYTVQAYRRAPPQPWYGRDSIAVFWAFSVAHLSQATSTDAFVYCPYLNALFFFLLGAVIGVYFQVEKPAEPAGEPAAAHAVVRSARATASMRRR